MVQSDSTKSVKPRWKIVPIAHKGKDACMPNGNRARERRIRLMEKVGKKLKFRLLAHATLLTPLV